jgi:hypothetical protein
LNVINIKKAIYNSILSGLVSIKVIDLLMQDKGFMLAKECELWDYKKTFETSNEGYVKILKSIVSFHNTHGGYIFFGVDETVKDSVFQICGIERGRVDQQKFRGQFDKYFNQRLDLTYEEVEVNFEEKIFILGVLHIPKRDKTKHTVSAVKEGQNLKNDVILAKNVVYIRKLDECRQVITQEDFEFAVGSRDFMPDTVIGVKNRRKIIEHNLPDKNFICPFFIGRLDILQELWAWLADDFQYTKVLAADGGKGKTSIAYEFCQLILKSGSELFEQVIWLTAKQQQFKASHNQYITTPQTHYEDLASLLVEICLRTGSLASELEDQTLHQLQRTAKESLSIIPSLIVIDDIDSNLPDEQRRIMECARAISCSASKILMTTRVNNIYSTDTCILVPGLKGKDYAGLVDSLCKTLKLQPYNEKRITQLRDASEGSPLFTESILRLCKLGLSVDNAIDEWKGKSGDAVREAALRKEVAELSPEAIKVLLAICSVGSLSRSELHQYTELENSEISKSIEQLGDLFLIQSLEFIKEEPRFESTASISKLTLSIAGEILAGAEFYLNKIKEIAAGLEANTQVHIPEIGAAIRQSNALLSEDRYNDARNTVLSLINQPRYKENSDLFFMLAKTSYEDPLASDDLTRKSFNEAFIKGQRKPIFFEMWYQLEKNTGSKSSLFEVCEHAFKCMGNADFQWGERFAYSCYAIALTTHDLNKKLEYLVRCYEKSSKLIKSSIGEKWEALKKLNVQVVDLIWDQAFKHHSYKIAVRAIMYALNAGDIRSLNFERLIEGSNHFIFKKSDDEALLGELKQCLEWSPILLREAGTREALALKLDFTLQKFLVVYTEFN